MKSMNITIFFPFLLIAFKFKPNYSACLNHIYISVRFIYIDIKMINVISIKDPFIIW